MKDYRLGFSVRGLTAVILVLIPNIIWSVLPHETDVLEQPTTFGIFDLFENIFRVLLIILLIFVVNEKSINAEKRSYLIACSIVFITAYYFMWILLLLGFQSGIVYIGLAVFPCAFFLLTAVILRNYLSMFAVVIFAVFHIIITFKNYF